MTITLTPLTPRSKHRDSAGRRWKSTGDGPVLDVDSRVTTVCPALTYTDLLRVDSQTRRGDQEH